MQIISGSSNRPLARNIAQNTGYEILEPQVGNFRDGELRIEIREKIGKDIILVQSTSPPVNDSIMELLLLADTAARAGAKNITSVIPYFGYSRQGPGGYTQGPFSFGLIIRLLKSAGITKIIALDLHSARQEDKFGIPLINLKHSNIFTPFYQDEPGNIIVSPDQGGAARAQDFATLWDKELLIFHKTRDREGKCQVRGINGEVRDRKCIIIDDIVDSADTLCQAADLLKKNGALHIQAYVTHAVLSPRAREKIMLSDIEKIFVSDSIYQPYLLPAKFTIISVGKLIARMLKEPLSVSK